MSNALHTIQQKLKAPKSEYNEFGHYSYRSKENILEKLKPLLAETKADLYFDDLLVLMGSDVFIQSTATLTAEGDAQIYRARGFAQHAKELKGMQPAQITGATSSYAQKSAMEALFLIDGSGNLDAMKPDVSIRKVKTVDRAPIDSQAAKGLAWLNAGTTAYNSAVTALKQKITTIENLKESYRISKMTETKLLTEAK